MIKHIVIIDKSTIIQEGLAKIFKDRNLAQKVSLLNNPEEFFHIIRDAYPEFIFLNPAFLDCSLNKFKKKYTLPATTKVVGIIYRLFENDVLNRFDENIYINDSGELIMNKIHNCCKENNTGAGNSEELLSEREEEILKLLVKGYSNKKVADKLCLSVHTVTTHRRNIIEKTGIKSLSGLAVYAIINNISDINEIQ